MTHSSKAGSCGLLVFMTGRGSGGTILLGRAKSGGLRLPSMHSLNIEPWTSSSEVYALDWFWQKARSGKEVKSSGGDGRGSGESRDPVESMAMARVAAKKFLHECLWQTMNAAHLLDVGHLLITLLVALVPR